MASLIAPIAVLLVVAYGLLVVVVWRFQERIVYQPPARGQGPVGSPARFKGRDGAELWAWMVGS